MKKAKVYVSGEEAGILVELSPRKNYKFEYNEHYSGPPVSLSMPISRKVYEYDTFPSFFDGLLPEGYQLEALLKTAKIDKNDLFSQLIAVGEDMIGTVTVKEMEQDNHNDTKEVIA